jgi:hypothetical protein
MTDREILVLVDRLERCSISPAHFHHGDHLTVAVAYLYGAELEPAMERMRSSLVRFLAYHGAMGYNETLTRFWMLQVEKHLDRNLCLQNSVERIRSQLADKNLIYEYYSKELVTSPEAKRQWVDPDLKKIV